MSDSFLSRVPARMEVFRSIRCRGQLPKINLSRPSSDSSPTYSVSQWKRLSRWSHLIGTMTVSFDLSCCSNSGLQSSYINCTLPTFLTILFPPSNHYTRTPNATNALPFQVRPKGSVGFLPFESSCSNGGFPL